MMKVGFNPNLSFKSNLIQDVAQHSSAVNRDMAQNPIYAEEKEPKIVSEQLGLEPLKEDIVDFDKQQKDAAEFRSRLKDKKWSKEYKPESNVVYIKQKNMYDGTEYVVDQNGQVTKIGTWIKPEVIMNPNKEMADFYTKYAPKQVVSPTKEDKPGNVVTRGISNVWKFFSVFGTMAGAVAKGLFYGAVSTLTAGLITWGVTALPKVFKQEGPKLAEIVRHPLKNMGKKGKILSVLFGLGVMAYHLIMGKLTANQNTAVIDHKMKTGHRDA